MGEKVTEDQLHEILSDVDIAKNAKVDLGEFLQVRTRAVLAAGRFFPSSGWNKGASISGSAVCLATWTQKCFFLVLFTQSMFVWAVHVFFCCRPVWCICICNWQNVLGTHHASAHGGSSDLIVKMLDSIILKRV